MPIREISRRAGLSRNTIRKYLREGVVEPRFETPSRTSKLDPYADRLSAWLPVQTRKSRKERRTVKQMYADLVKLGYDGFYGRVAAFARSWRADRHRAEQTTGRGTFVPLVFQPGEALFTVGPSDNGGGQVEKNVQDARNRLWQVMPVFSDLAGLNQWLEDRCLVLWAETNHRDLPGTIADIWEAEKPMLMALPPAFDGFVEHSKRVSPTCLITFERNRYSLPASFANRPVKASDL